VGRPILAAAGFSRLPVLPSPPGDVQASPLFHEISRAEGPLQQPQKAMACHMTGNAIFAPVEETELL
jgi:hypothetical protein